MPRRARPICAATRKRRCSPALPTSPSTAWRSRRAHLVAGFGRIVDLKPADILTEIADAAALVEAEADAIAHMNADHAEACRLYATRLLGAPDGDWRCVGIDPEGIELQQGRDALRLAFPQRVTGPGPLRAVLKELAEQARAR